MHLSQCNNTAGFIPRIAPSSRVQYSALPRRQRVRKTRRRLPSFPLWKAGRAGDDDFVLPQCGLYVWWWGAVPYLALFSAALLFARTSACRLSPPSILRPRRTSHSPSLTGIRAPLPPFAGSTCGPTIVCALLTLTPCTGWTWSRERSRPTSLGVLTTTFRFPDDIVAVAVRLLCAGTSTTDSRPSPFSTWRRSPPIPKIPCLNFSLHASRYLRARGGSTPSSRSSAEVKEKRAFQLGIFEACWLRLRPISVRNVCTSGTNGVGRGALGIVRWW